MRLLKIQGNYTIVKCTIDFLFDLRQYLESIFTFIREDNCLSIVYEKNIKNKNLDLLFKKNKEEGWCMFKMDAMIDFSSYGILKSVISSISDKKISVLVTSTFDTDYLFIKKESSSRAINIWRHSGIEIISD